jgi:hypothetical protein
MTDLASVQETSLDIVWIRDPVVCPGNRSADRCYRAVLAVQGPPEAFAPEVERLQPLLDGFASFLSALGQPSTLPPAALQALVLADPTDLAEYPARLEHRARALPRIWSARLSPTPPGRSGSSTWRCPVRNRTWDSSGPPADARCTSWRASSIG